MEVIVGVGAVAVMAAVAALLTFNRLVKLRNRVTSAWADLDVQLTRRRDLVPNLVAVVKAFAAHEQRLFDAVTAARDSANSAQNAGRRATAEEALGKGSSGGLAVAEAYPQLRADKRFRELSDELIATENKIAFSRQLYNDTVDAYRTAAQSFPGMFVAGPFGFAVPDFFAAEPATRADGTIWLAGD